MHIKCYNFFMKIGIISLGLIGGSIFKALADNGYDIIAVTRNPAAIEAAKKYTSCVSDNINSLKSCRVIFVCSPMNKTVEVLDSLENIVQPDTIVADVCSLKEFVMQKKRPYIFIGSHPMAGTEKNGFDSSFKELFEGAKWVLTPFDDTKEENINILKNIICSLGAVPIVCKAKEHDEAAALISHMPLLLAQALMKTAMNNKLALKLASSGFKDMTRLALSNTEMAEDMIYLYNINIKNSINDLLKNTNLLLSDNYSLQIKLIKEYRSKMYNQQGKNICN